MPDRNFSAEIVLARKMGNPDHLWRELKEHAESKISELANGPFSQGNGWYEAKLNVGLEAIECLKEATEVVSAEFDPSKYGRTIEAMAKIYKLLGRFSSLNDVGIEGVSRLFAPETGQFSEHTTSCIESAIYLYETALETYADYCYRRTIEGLQSEIGEAYTQLRRWDKAVEHFERAAEIGRETQFDVAVGREELSDLLRSFQRITECAGYSFTRAGRYLDAIAFTDNAKARLLLKFLGLNTFELADDKRLRIESLRDERATLELALNQPLVVERREKVQRVMDIRVELTEIAGEIEAPNPEVFRSRIASLLDTNTLLVMPILSSLGGETVFAFLQDGALRIDHARSKNAIYFKSTVQEERGSWLNRYALYKSSRDHDLAAHGKQLSEAITASSAAIDDLFTGSLIKALDALGLSQISRVLIVPHGAQARLPLAAARLPEGRHFLDRFEPVYLPSIGTVACVSELPSGEHSSLLAVANIRDDEDRMSNMPRFNDAECALVHSACFGEVKFLNHAQAEDGTRAVLSGLAESKIWHFTAHGRFNEVDPLQSHIEITSDHRVKLGELYASGHQSRPDLVVLSSCESGLYDCDDIPSEFIGWPAAFMELGAKGVIATQWPVASLPTAFLMGRLYEEIWNEQENTVPGALRAAQLWLRDVQAEELPQLVNQWLEAQRLSEAEANELLEGLRKSGCAADGRAFPEPIYWAGFVYYGDPELRLMR